MLYSDDRFRSLSNYYVELEPNTTPFKFLALAFACTLLWACSNGSDNTIIMDTGDPEFPGYIVVSLEPGSDLETRTLDALISAEPNSIIQLPVSIYDFVDGLSFGVDYVVLHGTGMDTESGTALRFDSDNANGAKGIRATGNNFLVLDLAMENTPGDAIKVKDANGVTFRRVRVGWTNGSDEHNGSYGLYPVGCRNVL